MNTNRHMQRKRAILKQTEKLPLMLMYNTNFEQTQHYDHCTAQHIQLEKNNK